MTKHLSQNLTSYDFLKTLAVVLMIIDHIGSYFFPEELWFRVLGRFCVPIWFFLIGYARTRDIPTKFWTGAAILVLANYAVGMPIFALNILITLIAVRLCIDFFSKSAFKSQFHVISICLVLFLLILPTNFIAEYGTLGILMAMFGYYLRHHNKAEHEKFIFGFMVFSILTYAVNQQIISGFSVEQFTILIIGLIAVNYMLLKFKPAEYADLTTKMPGFVSVFLRLFGRRTLEIYVLHLLLFKAAALYLGYEGFALFEFEIFDWEVFSLEETAHLDSQ